MLIGAGTLRPTCDCGRETRWVLTPATPDGGVSLAAERHPECWARLGAHIAKELERDAMYGTRGKVKRAVEDCRDHPTLKAALALLAPPVSPADGATNKEVK